MPKSGDRLARRLLVTGSATLQEMLSKGNVWYVRHYEAYFDRVCVAYVFGPPHEPVVHGKTTLVSLGTGRGGKIDLVVAPYRLYQLARRIRPTCYLTSDLVYSWWVCLLLKILLRARIHLMPVCISEQIYKISGKSLSGSLPIWIERILILFSLASADNILAGRHAGNLVNWLAYQPLVRKKLTIVDTLVDQLPSSGFFERLQVLSKTCARSLSKNGGFVLAYVGRLSREKMVEDLVRMMADLKGQNDTKVPIALYLIGDGPERSRLKKLAKKLDVEMMVKFVGSVRNEELPDYLLKAQAYVSPLTGTSLREAALCGLPIIAYDMDWIHGLLKHEETALLIPPGDYGEMARQVIRLASDDKLYNRLSQNVKQLAWRFWSPLGLRRALQQAFNNGQDPEQFIARTSTS